MRTNNHVYGEPSIWAKLVEAQMIKERKLTVILRLGDRSSREMAPKQWLPMFVPIQVYFLDEEAGRGGRLGFERDDGSTMQIVRRTVGRLGDLVDADLRFQDGTAVPVAAADAKRYFEEEMAPGKAFGPETVVTIYWIEWLPNEEPAADAPETKPEAKPDTTSGVAFDLGLYGDRTFPRS